MTFQITSPSGAIQVGYTVKDACYAACVLAEKERRFSSRKAQPVTVSKDGIKVADVWADAQEDA